MFFNFKRIAEFLKIFNKSSEKNSFERFHTSILYCYSKHLICLLDKNQYYSKHTFEIKSKTGKQHHNLAVSITV